MSARRSIAVGAVGWSLALLVALSSPRETAHAGRAPALTRPFDENFEDEGDLGAVLWSRTASAAVPPSSPLDGTTILRPAVRVNQDTHGGAQNEPAIAIDPHNPRRIVIAANDYEMRAWSCTYNGSPCSALGDLVSGTYYSNDGGETWVGHGDDPGDLGTIIPGVTRLSGGPYDAGGDPSVAFDSRGAVYFAGLGFDRSATPSTVAVNRGTFDDLGALHWSAPTFVNASTQTGKNDGPWLTVDAGMRSMFRDRVYVTWTLIALDGTTWTSVIEEAHSVDGGASFSAPHAISGNGYSTGARLSVAPDGSVYAVWWGAPTTAFQTISIWAARSDDGGESWQAPVRVADIAPLLAEQIDDTAAVMNSFPSAAVTRDGTVVVVWSTFVKDGAIEYSPSNFCTPGPGCHSVALFSVSIDGGTSWSLPRAIDPDLDASDRVPIGYPSDDGLPAPPPHRVDTYFPSVATSGHGHVYVAMYAADVVSPWKPCTTYVNTVQCSAFGASIHNARVDYLVTDLARDESVKVTPHPVNTRYLFRGRFYGDYASLAADRDGRFHAVWTDTNEVQTVDWWYGQELVPPVVTNQQDIATVAGRFGRRWGLDSIGSAP